MKRKLTAFILAFALALSLFTVVTPVEAATVQVEKAGTIPEINHTSELSTQSPVFTKSVFVDSKEETKQDNAYFEVTLTEDSWVIFWNGSSLVTSKEDGHSTHVDIYADAGFSNKLDECGSGYWEYTENCTGFLKKGTYYIHMKTTLGNYSEFAGNINMFVAAIPISKIFKTEISVNKNKKSATVTMKDTLGQYTAYAEYQPGNIGLSNVNNGKYWKWLVSGIEVDGSDSVSMLSEKDGAYTFQAKKNGAYTIMIQDKNGKRYSEVIKVSGIDSAAPSVKGVKNGKTYKNAVTITFSDKGTGVKSAKLNGKSIKTGTTVKKAGSYTLVVVDNAGNKKTVKFKIK